MAWWGKTIEKVLQEPLLLSQGTDLIQRLCTCQTVFLHCLKLKGLKDRIQVYCDCFCQPLSTFIHLQNTRASHDRSLSSRPKIGQWQTGCHGENVRSSSVTQSLSQRFSGLTESRKPCSSDTMARYRDGNHAVPGTNVPSEVGLVCLPWVLLWGGGHSLAGQYCLLAWLRIESHTLC